MTQPDPPDPPVGLKVAGAILWTDVQKRYELESHEERLLLEMCRTADLLDELAAILRREGAIEENTGRAHPALVESRQLKIAFARLSAALRLPSGDEGDHQKGARRPQRKVGVRGVYSRRAG